MLINAVRTIRRLGCRALPGRLSTRRPLLTAAVAALCAAAGAMPQGAWAASAYPNKPIRWIVPYAPGASNDVIARVMAQKLTVKWGVPVVVENHGGAGGLVGAELVARAAPDGYTMLMSNPGSNAINFALRTKTPYTEADFTHVALLGSSPIMLIAGANFPASNVQEVIALAKAKPGKLTGGSSGTGGSSHLALELFKMLAGVDIQHVPYKGAAPAITDMLAGRISIMFTTAASIQPQIAAGTAKALGVSGDHRLALDSQVPTMGEQGLKHFDDSIWFGVSVPAHTPTAVVSQLNRDMNDVLHDPDVKARFAALGVQPDPGSTPARFTKVIDEDTARWRKVIDTAKIDMN